MKILAALIVALVLASGCADLGSPPEIPLPELTVRGDTTSEGEIAECEIELSFEAQLPVTVIYTLQGVTATAGADFVAATDTVIIEASDGTGHGENHVHVEIPLLQDDQIEPIEELRLHIVSATNAILVERDASCFILDDDGEPYMSVDDINVIEGQPAMFEVMLSKTGIAPVIFDYSTVAGTAGAGVDFEATTGTDTIPIGATSTIVEINTIDDTTYDQFETFSLTLSNPRNGSLLDSVAIATISDNDPRPSPSFASEIKPIIAARCALSVCHGGSASQGGLNFGAIGYHDVVHATADHGPIVVVGDGANSALYFKVTTSPRFGSRMPPGGPYLSTVDIQKIKDWIDAGAPDN
ncbi:MAG: hypothetical protein NDJ18_06695 [candidate division Zixibacteria bacterium]|nr:hypothetical protein [candidate division Zixibacteria bacterium]